MVRGDSRRRSGGVYGVRRQLDGVASDEVGAPSNAPQDDKAVVRSGHFHRTRRSRTLLW
jgi:hypothetical protein